MNKKIDWNVLSSRHEMDITTISGIHSSIHKDLKKYAKTDDILFYSYCFNKNTSNYAAFKIEDFGRYLFNREIHSINDILKIINLGNNIINSSQELIDKYGGGIDDIDALQYLYDEFLKLEFIIGDIFIIKSFILVEYWQEESQNIIEKMIEKHNLKNKENEILNYIFRPYKTTALMTLKERLSNNEDIDDLMKEYQFLRSFTLIWHEPLDKKWFLDLAKNSKIVNGNYQDISRIISGLALNKEELKIIDEAPYMTYFKDYRDDIRRNFSYLWNFLFQKIAQKFDISYNDLGYLSIFEIKELIEGKDLTKKIIHRKNHPCVVTRDNQYKILLIDENLPAEFQDYRLKFKEAENDIIKGLPTYSGNVKAEVKIINSYDDVKNFPFGKILVARSTQPNYLPAMQRAKAFITDEGGILCHAAITSRELRKPCIVGTKVATKVLKDGDMVEVDADKGVVKIL